MSLAQLTDAQVRTLATAVVLLRSFAHVLSASEQGAVADAGELYRKAGRNAAIPPDVWPVIAAAAAAMADADRAAPCSLAERSPSLSAALSWVTVTRVGVEGARL